MDSKVVDKEASTDEVDFVPTSAAKKEICVSCKSFNPLKKGFLMRNQTNTLNNNHIPKTMSAPPTKKTSVYGDCEIQTAVKSHISALERLHLFHFPLRKKSESQEKLSTLPKEARPRLIKSSSIARLFGNTYSTKKSEESHASVALRKSNSVSEKFSNKSSESDDEFTFRMSENPLNFSESSLNLNSLDSSSAPMEKTNLKAIRSITKGLGKLLRRNCDSAPISAPDPEYKVFYLGNVLTGWAKGECLEYFRKSIWVNWPGTSGSQEVVRKKTLKITKKI